MSCAVCPSYFGEWPTSGQCKLSHSLIGRWYVKHFQGVVSNQAMNHQSYIVQSSCLSAFQNGNSRGEVVSVLSYSSFNKSQCVLARAINNVTRCSYNSLNVWYPSDSNSLSLSGRLLIKSWIEFVSMLFRIRNINTIVTKNILIALSYPCHSLWVTPRSIHTIRTMKG